MTHKQIIAKAIEIACMLFGLKQEDVVGQSRLRNISNCRACIYYAVRLSYTGIRFWEIAEFIPRDHGTMINGINLILGMQKANPKYLNAKDVMLIANAQATTELLRKFIETNP
jgi:chromosomal replication initiation ATPase DnaA